MKTQFKIAIYIVLLSGLYACQDDYLTDGGTSKAKTALTTYEYLDQHKYNMFDTLIMLIDHLDLQDSVNNAATFFAPNNYNIANYLDDRTDSLRDETGVEDTTYSLDNLMNDITANDILQYGLNDAVTLEDASTDGMVYTSMANTSVTVKKTLATDDEYYVYSDYPVYFLYFCKPDKEEERCQTTGILTQNGEGTILHALNNEHIFMSFSEENDD